MSRPGTPQKRYTEAEKLATLELAGAMGRRAAVRHLGISPTTFQRWTEQFPEFWSEIRAGNQEVQKHQFARNLEDLAESYAAQEFDALERAEKLLKTADAKELAALIRAMGASRGVANANARSYRGDDAQHVDIDINFPALEAAAEAILERAKQPPLLVENVEGSTDGSD